MACIGVICLNTFVGYCVDGNVATVPVAGYWLKSKNGQYQQTAEPNDKFVPGDRREPGVFEMASRRLLCEVGWGTSGRWPRYTMPFK